MPALLALLGLLTSAAAAGGGGGKKAAVIDAMKKVFVPKKTEYEPAAPESEPVAKFTPAKPYKKVFEKPVAKETPEVVAKEAPTPEPAPAPATPVVAEPTPAPAPATPVVAEPTPAPAPVTPVVAEPTPAPAPATPVVAAPEPAPAPTPVVTPTAPTQGSGSTDGGETDPISTISGSYSVDGGRVTTLEVQNAENVASVRVLDGPSHGNLTVNPDNTLALVMSMDHTFSGNMSMSYEVSYNDGSTQVFNDNVYVSPVTQGSGWGDGEYYMLEEAPDGDLIVETGENHRDVYVSANENALSLNDIAQMEGISANQVTGSWLANNPQYGGSEGMALDQQAGMRLWSEITGVGAEPSSHWLRFESGHEYNELGGLFNITGITGESALHPVHITSYGEGARPVINSEIAAFNYGSGLENVVVSGIETTDGFRILETGGRNLIIDDARLTDEQNALVIQNFNKFTLNNTEISDTYFEEHPDGAAYWTTTDYSAAGAYIAGTDGVLVQNSLFDHNGWAPDYQYDLSTDGGSAPIILSHNLYIQADNIDTTLRDNIILRGASFGAQVRNGGLIEDNVFIDNNVGLNFLGGDFYGAGQVGNFSLTTDNVVTSAGYKEINGFNGLINGGIYRNTGNQSTLLDNIVAHLADPNNPDEQAAKPNGGQALESSSTPYYDDTIIHNWLGSVAYGTTGVNTEGLDTATLNATTIQIFTQQLLGNPNAGIDDLATYLRAQHAGQFEDTVDADLIVAFFQGGFGVSVDGRIGSETIRFVPNDLGDGIRWDNRLNWETEDLPGTVTGDSVDLGGNYVNYGGTNTVDQLDFGAGGTLNVTHGRLNIEEFMTVGDGGAQLNTTEAGQVWSNGFYQTAADTNRLDLNIDGGRFANTGLFHGNADIDVTDGQLILATDGADFVLRDGSELEIVGNDADVGFDGGNGGTGVLLLDEGATLHFDAEGNRLGTIEEFRSGAYGENGPNIQSGVNLGDSTLQLDLSGWSGGASSNTLIEVDEVIGDFSDINVVGLAGNRDAELVVNYDDDTVVLNISAAGAGSGQVSNSTTGDAGNAAANNDLWAALTEGHGIYADDTAEVEEEEDFLAEVA